MAENMYSAEEAAQILGLQVRTVRNYVREGRLPGVRIGKQYRIARADLEAFTAGGLPRDPLSAAPHPTEPARSAQMSAEVSSVVQIDGIGEAAADRVERTIIASALAAGGGAGLLRVEPLYDPDRRRMKIIIVGRLEDTADLLRVIDLFSGERP
jgi:excisionase family DNA binding protein